MALIFAAAMPLALAALKSEGRTSGRAEQVVKQTNAFERITREIRQAKAVGQNCFSPCTTRIQVRKSSDAPYEYVRIYCDPDTRPGHSGERICTRYDVDSSNANINGFQVIEGVINNDIFTCPDDSGNLVACTAGTTPLLNIKMQIEPSYIKPSSAPKVVTLQDGISFRNS